MGEGPTLPGDSYWVEEGSLLAGPYPGAPTRAEAREKLNAFIEVGVTMFVDLTEEGEGPPLHPYDDVLAEVAEERGVGVQHRRIAVRDLDVPSDDQMREILDTIDQTISEGGTAYLHCWGGVGRTGTVVGCRMVERGVDPTEVISRIARLRQGTKRSSRKSPENDAQRDFVLAWKAPQPTTATLGNPSLSMAANVYRRRYGNWPSWAQFAPHHFAHWVTTMDPEALAALGTVLRITSTIEERSLRVTVGGSRGAVTYDDGVTELDWDTSVFDAWVFEEAARRASGD